MNGLDEPKPWALGEGYEQGDPGWYIYSLTSLALVLVLDDDAPLTREHAERLLEALGGSAQDPGLTPRLTPTEQLVPILRLKLLAQDPRLTRSESDDVVRAIQGLQHVMAGPAPHGAVRALFDENRPVPPVPGADTLEEAREMLKGRGRGR